MKLEDMSRVITKLANNLIDLKKNIALENAHWILNKSSFKK